MTASRIPAPPARASVDVSVPVTGEPAPAYASWSRRLVGMLLDLSLVATVTWVVAGEAPFLSPAPGFPPGGGETGPAPEALSLPWWTLAVLYLGLVCLQAYTGSTPGKAAVGIRVIGERTGRPAGVATTVLRWFAHFLDLILFIGYLRPLWHAKRQTFADSLLTTVVVRAAPGRMTPWRITAIIVTTVTAALSLVSGGGGRTVVETTASCTAAGSSVSVTYEREESWRERGFIRRDRPPTWSAQIVVSGLAPGTQRVDLVAAERVWRVDITDHGTQSWTDPGGIELMDTSETGFTGRIAELDARTRTAPLDVAARDAAGLSRPLCTATPAPPPAA